MGATPSDERCAFESGTRDNIGRVLFLNALSAIPENEFAMPMLSPKIVF